MTQSITWAGLAWCGLPIAMVCMIFVWWKGSVTDVIVASLRMVIQLVGIGYILVLIFEQPSLWISSGVLVVMLSAAAWISIRPVNHHNGFLFPAFIALALAVGVHLAITLFLVLDIDTWYDPRVMIPLAGMYFANAMNAVSLSMERYHSELHDGKAEPVARGIAFQAAMIPQINSLLAVGLVALPGMMTGQILSGVSPLIAVRYQILIMSMVLGASGMSSAFVLWYLNKRKTAVEKIKRVSVN